MKMSKEQEYKKIIKENLNNTLDFGFLPELGKHKSGKVREIHFTSDKIGSNIIMVASDRVSAFDHVLGRSIPFKGKVLNLLNQWAMENTKDIVPNASVDSPHPSVIVQKLYKNIMIECVVRGYVWGSLAGAYEKGRRNFCGLEMPNGLLRYQELDSPLFTPTTKSEHDEPMTFEEVEQQLGRELAAKVRDVSLKLFKRGAELAQKAGLIFIDTKYEFGLDEQGSLFLIDESNTPDSSRYCSIEEYKKFDLIRQEMATGQFKNVSELLKHKPELKIKEMSKQFIRDVLTEKGFSYGGTGKIPKLTDEDVVEVSYRYINLYEMLTGKTFEFPSAHPKVELLSKLQQSGLIKGGLAVIMAGSDSDMPHIEKIQAALADFNVKSQVRICSAHKQPGLCESIVKKYNTSLEPVVFIAVAGGTDALSGVASFHSVFPVISCPPKAEEYHSGIKNPPGSSNSLILRPVNAARHAAQILSFYNENIRKLILDKNNAKIKKLEIADKNTGG
jgi:phosphoribosylaminoimidazole-succinocarboxamide synthase